MLRKLQQLSPSAPSERLAATLALRLQQSSSAAAAALVAVLENATDVADVACALAAMDPHDQLPHGGAAAAPGDSKPPPHTETPPPSATVALSGDAVPDSLACVICCEELMLQPASLPCGHSFCRRCLDVWLTSCSSCPTCRRPASTQVPAVNVALQDVTQRFFPKELQDVAQRDHDERRQQLRGIVQRAIESGIPIRDILRQEEHHHHLRAGGHDPQAEVRELLDSDTELQEQILAAENREQMRKERALREASRRRHMMAYCHGLPAAVVAQRVTSTPTPMPLLGKH
ncbi:hypothetical protein ATCC90586_003969 [Pythium insidiosum]|nr:hypothetical protein ATCC90586_003969 [Pythium insidiosum]